MSTRKYKQVVSSIHEIGLIKVQNFQSSKRKLAYAYLLTPAGIAKKRPSPTGF